MKNYVTSAVLEEAPCMNLADLGLVAKLNTSKGIFISIYKSTPTSLLRELASMKVGDKVDIFFRFESLQLDVCKGKEQVKCFYDVKIHEGDIKRFKQCLWHERMPVIAEIDMFKARYYLPLGEDLLTLGEDLLIEKIPSYPPSYFVVFILLSFLAILPVCGYLCSSFLIKMLVP